MRKNFWLGIITEDKYEKLYSKKTKGMCTFMSKTNKKGSAIALLPILVFLLIFIGSGVLTGDFYSMPAPYSLYREYKYGKIKLTVYHRGGNEDAE